jgi:hypothetical protein
MTVPSSTYGIHRYDILEMVIQQDISRVNKGARYTITKRKIKDSGQCLDVLVV